MDRLTLIPSIKYWCDRPSILRKCTSIVWKCEAQKRTSLLVLLLVGGETAWGDFLRKRLGTTIERELEMLLLFQVLEVSSRVKIFVARHHVLWWHTTFYGNATEREKFKLSHVTARKIISFCTAATALQTSRMKNSFFSDVKVMIYIVCLAEHVCLPSLTALGGTCGIRCRRFFGELVIYNQKWCARYLSKPSSVTFDLS